MFLLRDTAPSTGEIQVTLSYKEVVITKSVNSFFFSENKEFSKRVRNV